MLPAHDIRKYGTILYIVPYFLLSWSGSMEKRDKKQIEVKGKRGERPQPLAANYVEQFYS